VTKYLRKKPTLLGGSEKSKQPSSGEGKKTNHIKSVCKLSAVSLSRKKAQKKKKSKKTAKIRHSNSSERKLLVQSERAGSCPERERKSKSVEQTARKKWSELGGAIRRGPKGVQGTITAKPQHYLPRKKNKGRFIGEPLPSQTMRRSRKRKGGTRKI